MFNIEASVLNAGKLLTFFMHLFYPMVTILLEYFYPMIYGSLDFAL